MKTVTTIKACDLEQFIQHSRKIAKLIDQKYDLPEESHILLGDSADLLKLLRAKNRALIRVIREHPGSITDIAAHLQREKDAVHRDVSELERLGIVAVKQRLVPEVGYVDEVHLTAKKFRLEADLT